MPLKRWYKARLNNVVLYHSQRTAKGKWIYASRGADFWFGQAKRHHSAPHFIIASVLSAQETWEIIGLSTDNKDWMWTPGFPPPIGSL